MNNFKRSLALLICVLLIIAVFAGCRRQDTAGPTPTTTTTSRQTDTQAPGTEEPVDEFAEKIDIRIAHWEIAYSITGDPDPVYDIVREALNVEIVPVTIGWGDYHEKVNLWAATGELPDVWSIDMIWSPNYRNWINNNLIRSLPEDLSRFPRVKEIVEVGDVAAYMVDGKNWFIPRANYPDPAWWAADRGILIRKDWMETLGYSDPTTPQEFINLMAAFANDDPNRTGRKDTIGLTAHNAGFLWSAGKSLAPNLHWGNWFKEDGEWIHANVSKQQFELLSFLRDLYEAGGLDPDFAVLRGSEGQEKFGTGIAGALALQPAAKHYVKIYDIWNSVFPEKSFEDSFKILKQFPDQNGIYWRFITASFWSESYINGNVDDAKMDRILALYNYLLEPDVKRMMTYGIEGVDYVLDDNGQVESLLGTNEDGTAITAGSKYPFLYSMGYLTSWGDEGQYDWPWIPEFIRRESKEYLDWSLANAQVAPIYWELAALETPTKADVAFDGGADRINFIMSSKSKEEAWQEILDKYNAMGYAKLQAEVAAAAAELGFN